MFERLKLKLTLINVVVVALVVAIFMGGVYFMMSRGMQSQSEQLMRLIAADSDSFTKNFTSRREWQRFEFFFVKVDHRGEIVKTSDKLPISPQDLKRLVEQTLASFGERGKISLNKHHQIYRYLKSPLKNTSGQTIVFLNAETEDDVIEHLLGAFTAMGLGCVTLTLLGGYLMANRALIPIKKSWERQKALVADASHELRTPLAVILTNLDVIKGNQKETVEEQLIWLENIETESKLMAKLVNDLLFLARNDSDQELMHKESFSLNGALADALLPFQPVASQKGIRLDYFADGAIDLYGDKTRLQQVITILVDNAIKHTPKGGRVALELQDLADEVEIRVMDTGEGIASQHLEKIFERFYRVDKARSRECGSTGLGLSIANSIVEAHHGTIKVSSTIQKGTAFVVHLPKHKQL